MINLEPQSNILITNGKNLLCTYNSLIIGNSFPLIPFNHIRKLIDKNIPPCVVIEFTDVI